MNTEISEYLEVLRATRRKVLATIEEVEPAAWNWTPTSDASNSLYVIATHAAGAEHGWLYEILGRGPQTRVRAKEFQAQAHDLAALHARYEEVAAETEGVLTPLTVADLDAKRFREGYGDISGRWMIVHVIEHYSEHLGQMYLTKQLWEQNKSR